MIRCSEMITTFGSLNQEQKNLLKTLGIVPMLIEKFPFLKLSSNISDGNLESIFASIIQNENFDAFNEIKKFIMEKYFSLISLKTMFNCNAVKEDQENENEHPIKIEELQEINKLLRDKINFMNTIVDDREKIIKDLTIKNEILIERVRGDDYIKPGNLNGLEDIEKVEICSSISASSSNTSRKTTGKEQGDNNNQIEINICNENGICQTKLLVTPTRDTLFTLKKEMENKLGFLPKTIQWKRREISHLDDQMILANLKISSNCKLIISQEDVKINMKDEVNIYIKLYNQQELNLNLHSMKIRVKDLKNLIFNELKGLIPIPFIRLIFMNNILDDLNTLEFYGIKSNQYLVLIDLRTTISPSPNVNPMFFQQTPMRLNLPMYPNPFISNSNAFPVTRPNPNVSASQRGFNPFISPRTFR